MKTIRVLLVDDNLALMDLIARYLTQRTQQIDISVVARASSGKEAIAKIAEWELDLVLMDIAMPGMNGFQAAHEIKAKSLPPRVILYSFNDSPEYRTASHDAGADGFVSKTEFWNDLMPQIRELFSAAVQPSVACAA